MSNNHLRKLFLLTALIGGFAFSQQTAAATFTAIASGNWSSSATWAGGNSPGSAVTNDQIVIGAAFDVNLDVDVEVDGLLSTLNVDGSLTTANASDLTITQGTLLGAGEIMVDEFMLGAGAIVTYSGSLVANSFSNTATSITLALDLTVNQTLNLMGGVLGIGSNGKLALQNNATIVVDGGSLSLTGSGLLNLTGNYNVVYNGTSSNSGLELSGTGLKNVTINLDNAGQSLNLNGDLTVNGMLNIQTGMLDLDGNDLTLNGGVMVGASGSLMSNSSSSITLVGGTGGSLNFGTGGQTVNNLNINLTSNATVELNSDLVVSGNLNISSATLDIRDVELTISGNLSGNGDIMANNNSSLTLDGNASLTGSLNITSSGSSNGGTIGDLEIDLGGSNSVSLGEDLTVSGMLTLTSGSLALNGNALTLTGNISGSGSGSINGSSTSSLNIMAGGNVSGDITLGGSGSTQTLENLVIDIDNNGSVSLGSNITVVGMLSLQSGNFNTNGNTVTVGAGTEIMLDSDANLIGTGNFNGSAGYNLTVTGSNDVNIGIFGTGSGMGDLTIDFDNTSANATVGNDLTISGTLNLQSGNLNIGGNDLTLNGDISGGLAGSISSTGGNTIVVNSSTSTTGGLSFSSTGNTVGSLAVNIQDSGGMLNIFNDVNIEDNLNFTSGLVVLANGDLTIMSGGTITGSGSDSYIVTNGEGSLMLDIAANGDAMFDVGTADNYAPAMISLNGSGSGMFGVRVDDDVLNGGTTGSSAADVQSVVDATWHITSDVSTGLDLDLTVEWASTMEVNSFNRDSAYISHYINGAWDTDTEASATAMASGRFSLTRTGITSLSPFAVFDKDASVGIREIAAVENLNIYPNPAVNTLTVPGSSNNTLVKIIDLNGATVLELNQASYQDLNVDVTSLTNGIYVVKVVGENSVSTGRFVKN